MLQANCNNYLFLIGNEPETDEFVANAISHTNIISNLVDKQEQREAAIVFKFTSSRGTTWLPMPNELSRPEPAIGKSCMYMNEVQYYNYAYT